MPFKIHLSKALRAVIAAAFLPLAARAQGPCAPGGGDTLAGAWRAYRAGALDSAAALFHRADDLCPAHLHAKVGLGFVGLRQDRAGQADSLFKLVIARDSTYAD